MLGSAVMNFDGSGKEFDKEGIYFYRVTANTQIIGSEKFVINNR